MLKIDAYFQDGTCKFNKSKVAASLTGMAWATYKGDEEALKQAVATVGPVSVAIDASHFSFQQYNRG